MALYRAEVKPISRSKGHNAVAAAAYRAGEELTDKNKYNPNAMVHDYSKKSDIMHKNIILPAVLAEQDFKIDRENLWSMVEEHEVTKKDKTIKASARVAREWLLALPHELSDSENIALAEEFATKMANDLGVIADCCIHNPKLKSNDPAPKPSSKAAAKITDDDDERNIHAHIMFTTRKAELNTANQLIFTDKADSELDGTARKAKGLVKETEYIKAVRADWAELVNKRLLEHGIKAVSSLSYKDQDLYIIPKTHVGRDKYSDDKREHNTEVNDFNERFFNKRADYLKKFADSGDRFLRVADELNGKHLNESGARHTRIANSERIIADSKQRIANPSRSTTPNPFAEAITRSIAARKSAATSYDQSAEAFDRASDDSIAAVRKLAGVSSQGIKQRKPRVTQYAEYAKNTKIILINKILQRCKEENKIRLSWGESTDDLEHAHKFDPRQLEILNAFANKYQLDKSRSEPFEDAHERRLKLLNNDDFFQENIEIFDLVRDPKSERETYNARKLSDSRQNVLSKDSEVSYGEQFKDLDRANSELSMDNNVLRPRF